jgi:murein DD-endopeptidase MepM/ murein hydrolase activator NlpD
MGQIVSALDGRVVESKPDSSVGGIVGIASSYKGKKVLIRYVHLDRDPLRRLKVGDRVQAGQYLSSVSQTFPGSSGPHPHIEVYLNGKLNWHPHQFLSQAK